MPDNYQVITSYRTIQVLSATTVQDAEYVICSTYPTGIGFAYAVPLEVWQANQATDQLSLLAAELENLVTNYHVVAGAAVQDIDDNGLLADNVDLIVQYNRPGTGLPPLQGTVSIPIGILLLEATDPELVSAAGIDPPPGQVEQEYLRLQALAGG